MGGALPSQLCRGGLVEARMAENEISCDITCLISLCEVIQPGLTSKMPET